MLIFVIRNKVTDKFIVNNYGTWGEIEKAKKFVSKGYARGFLNRNKRRFDIYLTPNEVEIVELKVVSDKSYSIVYDAKRQRFEVL